MRKFNAYIIDIRDRAFSPYRIPYDAGPTVADEHRNIAQKIVEDVLTQVRSYELHAGLRKRGRRKSAHDNLMAAITALVCDLMHRAVTSEKGAGRIHLSRSTARNKKTRYRAEFEGRSLIEALDLLAVPEMGFVKLAEHGDYYLGRQSAYVAGDRLLDRIYDHNIVAEDLTLSDDEEIVILKSAKKARGRLSETHENRAQWIDYKDTKLSNQYRDDMRRINGYLRHADIDYSGGKFIDLTNRRQRRYFNNGQFIEGGRLFGGFWLSGFKAKQRKLIVIDGCAVEQPDFKAMMPSLAYANQGISLPADFDPYLPPGIGSCEADRLKWRTGVKRLFGALMFSESPVKNWPKGIREENFRDCDHTLPEIIAAIKAHNEPLEPVWERGLGHHYHFEESEIIVASILECIERNITALQVHDGLVVSHTKAKQATEIMMSQFEAQTGQTTIIPVSPVRLPRTR